MSLPSVPENLENIAVIREFLSKFRDATDAAIIAGGGGGGGSGDIKSDGTVAFAANESMGGFKLINVGTPAAGGDAANKTYVDTNDKYAATVIVDPSGVIGAYTTIALAIAALPVGGGVVFVKQGTYTISSTQVLPNKDIIIVGAGIGTTTISFTGTGSLFSQANGKHFTLRHLSITGDGVTTGQTILTTTSTDADVYFESIEINSVNHIVNDTGGTSNTFTFTDAEMNLPAIDLTSSFYKGVSTGTVIWNYTSVTLSEASRISASGGAFLGSPKWVADHSYIGGPPPSAISDFVIGQAIFDGLRADAVKIQISGNKSQIYGLEGTDCVVYFTGSDLFISHSYFKRVLGIGFENQLLNVTGAGDEIHVADSTFDGGGNVTNGLIFDGTTQINVNNCHIKNFTVIGIFINAAAQGAVTGNVFTNSGTPVSETSSSAAMVYGNNSGFSGSTIVGAGSTVNGFLRKDVVGGTTTDLFVDQFTHVNTKGLAGSGSIKNTGGSNTLTLRISATDVYGTTDTLVADVLPGAATTWSMADAVGTSLPPYISYTLAVKSTSAGNSTTFTLHHATTGAY